MLCHEGTRVTPKYRGPTFLVTVTQTLIFAVSQLFVTLDTGLIGMSFRRRVFPANRSIALVLTMKQQLKENTQKLTLIKLVLVKKKTRRT